MDRVYLETKIHTGENGEIEGVAWKYAQPDRIGDVITKGAFGQTKLPMPMLFGHDQNDPIGTWETTDDRDDGLHLKGRLLVEDVVRAREVAALVKSGAVRGISIGFRTIKSAKRPRGGRTIQQLELLEASLVTIPMHPGAQVTSAKSAIRALQLATMINRAAAHITR